MGVTCFVEKTKGFGAQSRVRFVWLDGRAGGGREGGGAVRGTWKGRGRGGGGETMDEPVTVQCRICLEEGAIEVGSNASALPSIRTGCFARSGKNY